MKPYPVISIQSESSRSFETYFEPSQMLVWLINKKKKKKKIKGPFVRMDLNAEKFKVTIHGHKHQNQPYQTKC